MSDFFERSLIVHEQLRGKLGIVSRVPIHTRDDLAIAYTPGVARPCEVIAADPRRARDLTIKRNSVAVVSDGSAVLGLGNIGPEAAIPVMEDYRHGSPYLAGVWRHQSRRYCGAALFRN